MKLKYFSQFLILLLLNSCTPSVKNVLDFDWQGHRGARGLLPENSIPAMLKALDLGVKTLEMDLAVTADNQLVLSHEPWLNHDICSKSDGSPITKEEAESFKIKNMTAAELKNCDCGSRGNPRFKQQQPMKTYKPTLSELIDSVKNYCEVKKRDLPFFNIEIKSRPDWDAIFTPSVDEFAALVLKELNRLNIIKNVTIQSFDARALEAIHKLDNSVSTAFLIENKENIEKNLASLSFKPTIYSPNYVLVNQDLIKFAHNKNIKVIPWTVNDATVMRDLKNMGVDGMITDYPNLILTIK